MRGVYEPLLPAGVAFTLSLKVNKCTDVCNLDVNVKQSCSKASLVWDGGGEMCAFASAAAGCGNYTTTIDVYYTAMIITD